MKNELLFTRGGIKKMASESIDFMEDFGEIKFAELNVNNPNTFDFESSFNKFLSSTDKIRSPFYYLSHTKFGEIENDLLDDFTKSFEAYLAKK